MKNFLLLALPYAAKLAGGMPTPEDVYELHLTVTQCTAGDKGSGSQYTGTCDATEKPGYVFLNSDTCANISGSSCRVKRMQCNEFPHFHCINADHANMCQPTAASPVGIYTTSGQCPQGLLCCQGTINEPPATDDVTSLLHGGVLDEISPGATNPFLGIEGDDAALLYNNNPLYQSFTDESPGSTSIFDTADNLNLGTFQLDSNNPPMFAANQFDDNNNQFLTGDSIIPGSGDENQQFVASASDSDPSLFL